MLHENLKSLRKAKGLSQEELAVKLNVVRQTVSKWEQGLSVPDSDMLISISEALETPVSVLLGETVAEKEPDDLKAISEKLRRKALHWFFIILCALIVVAFVLTSVMDQAYLNMDQSVTENVVIGTFVHAFAWVYLRLAPFALVGAIVGAVLTRKK